MRHNNELMAGLRIPLLSTVTVPRSGFRQSDSLFSPRGATRRVVRGIVIGLLGPLFPTNCIDPPPRNGSSALLLPIRHQTATTSHGTPDVSSTRERLERSKASAYAKAHWAAKYRMRLLPCSSSIGRAASRKTYHRHRRNV